MNWLRQLWHLIRNDNETPLVVRSREVAEESELRQAVSETILEQRSVAPGPLLDYIWGGGRKRNE